MAAYILMNTGGFSGARWELSPAQENLIGRDLQCLIVLNDPQCSRVHACIYQDEDGWWIADRNSSNGTYVADQPIDLVRLVEGIEIRIGSSLFQFSLKSSAAEIPDEPGEERPTIVSDRNLNTQDFGLQTLSFLTASNLKNDFSVLFQLAVKLLGVDHPNEVISISMLRLFERTGASAAGFLWLSDTGVLRPIQVIPKDQTNAVELKKELTKRVVLEKKAIRVEYDSQDKGGVYADAICVPLIATEKKGDLVEEQVQGAIHLYRQNQRFLDSHMELACAFANIMMRTLRRAHERASLAAELSSLVKKTGASDELLGESPKMQELKSRIQRVAKAQGCVLIRGESGAGKELVARALHRASPRADRPMLTVNCAAIPRELMESQLFGHKKGAFTSADRDHVGWFQQADRGTLFLDEIGELTLEGQSKLLRILEGHPFMPVGSSEPITVDVRVICATNRDLQEFVAEKRFREDLFYRLSVYELAIPPLRDRSSDIQLLIDYFLKHFRERHGKFDLKLSPEAKSVLLSYNWPGNVRQLRNVIDSAVVMSDGQLIQVEDLGIRDARAKPGAELESLRIDYWEKKLIAEALKRTGENIPEAAKLLGMSRATLYRKIDEYKHSPTTEQ